MRRRTYWHLESLNRRPTEYEIVTTKLLYYPDRGFEVEVPASEWYARHQTGSPLVLSDADRFHDPRETTYPKYTALQKDREIYVDGLLQSIEDTHHDRDLPPAWIRLLPRILSPLRFPVHALQMAAAYVGQMAPGSRIAIAALFQAADEIRYIQRLAYRMRQLQETYPGFGDDGRSLWQEDPIWQPARELVENLLVTYDWGEAFVALNMAVKPVFDDFFLLHFGALASRSGDTLLEKIFLSLHDDARWHRDWSAALVRTAAEDRFENAAVIRSWIRQWHPRALGAVAPFESLFGPMFPGVMERIEESCSGFWESARIPPTGPESR
jgi:hypothetical protein